MKYSSMKRQNINLKNNFNQIILDKFLKDY